MAIFKGMSKQKKEYEAPTLEISARPKDTAGPPHNGPCDRSATEVFGRVHMIPVELVSHRFIPAREVFEEDSLLRLADSIRRYGVLQPITVRRIVKAVSTNAQGKELFEIVAGERRFRAALLLGMTGIPSIIINADDRKSAELALVENMQRENLNIFEEAAAMSALIDSYGLTQSELASRLSLTQSAVSNKLRLLRLTEEERAKIIAARLSERHARAVLPIDDPALRLRAIEYAANRALSVKATEEYVERLLIRAKARKSSLSTRKIVLKDIRVFYNSIDHAIALVKQAGINVESERVEDEEEICLTIRIPKPSDSSRENVSCETLKGLA